MRTLARAWRSRCDSGAGARWRGFRALHRLLFRTQQRDRGGADSDFAGGHNDPSGAGAQARAGKGAGHMDRSNLQQFVPVAGAISASGLGASGALVDVKPDGSLRLNLDYFDYCTGRAVAGQRFHKLLGLPPRKRLRTADAGTMDLAAASKPCSRKSCCAWRARWSAANEHPQPMRGRRRVVLSRVGNGKILRDGHFKNLRIRRLPANAGGALGGCARGIPSDQSAAK